MFCENCGNKIGNESVTCPYCGAPVAQDETMGFQNFNDPGMQYHNRPYGDDPRCGAVYKKWWFWLLIVLLIGAIAAAVFFILQSRDKGDQSEFGNNQTALIGAEDNSASTGDAGSEKVPQLTPKVTQSVGIEDSGNGSSINGNSGNESSNNAIQPIEPSEESGSPIVVPPSGNTSNGQTANSASDYIFADSNSRYLTADEVRSKSAADLRIARNEIFARRGRMFKDAELQAYFNSKSWYVGTIPAGSFNTSVFNDYEKTNLELIQKIEDEKK